MSTVKKHQVELFLAEADIKVGGHRPWDIQVHNKRFFNRILATGSLGMGDSYMDGDWDCQQIDELLNRFLRYNLQNNVKPSLKLKLAFLKAKLMNLQTKSRSKIVGKKHYDISNDLYTKMLDPYMQYSCGYWKNAKNLNEAQEHKLDLICRKLQLKKGMKVLDIGCGWGGLSQWMSEKHGVEVVGMTISKEQAKYAKERCKVLPVEIRVQDYRGMNGQFDRIVSVGMFEHVGYKNYGTFFDTVEKLLKSGGLFLLHTIGKTKFTVDFDGWLDKHIFPNALLPSPKSITNSSKDKFILEDWHNFGSDYDKTLVAWHNKMNNIWDQLQNSYDERFRRMWTYYLLCCAGTFRCRDNQLWQIVFSKLDYKEPYTSVR